MLYDQPLDFPFPKNFFSFSPYSCLPAPRMGQKHHHAGLIFKATVMGTCWDDWADGDCFLAFSLHRSIFIFFFFKPPPPTHTVRELIYSLSASSPDLHSGMCLERNTETKLRPPTCSVKWNNTKFTIKGGNKGFEVVQSTLLLISYLKKLSGYCWILLLVATIMTFDPLIMEVGVILYKFFHQNSWKFPHEVGWNRMIGYVNSTWKNCAHADGF